MKKKADATMVETALSTFKALFFFLTLCFVGGVGVIRVKQWRRWRQRERQKSNRFRQTYNCFWFRLIGKTTTLHVHHAFLQENTKGKEQVDRLKSISWNNACTVGARENNKFDTPHVISSNRCETSIRLVRQEYIYRADESSAWSHSAILSW